MTLEDTLKQLEALGNERMRAQNRKKGAGDSQFGVRLGEIRQVAKKVETNHAVQVADRRTAYVVKKHPEKEALRRAWMADDDPWAARAGWSLTSERIARNPRRGSTCRRFWVAASPKWAGPLRRCSGP